MVLGVWEWIRPLSVEENLGLQYIYNCGLGLKNIKERQPSKGTARNFSLVLE